MLFSITPRDVSDAVRKQPVSSGRQSLEWNGVARNHQCNAGRLDVSRWKAASKRLSPLYNAVLFFIVVLMTVVQQPKYAQFLNIHRGRGTNQSGSISVIMRILISDEPKNGM